MVQGDGEEVASQERLSHILQGGKASFIITEDQDIGVAPPTSLAEAFREFKEAFSN